VLIVIKNTTGHNRFYRSLWWHEYETPSNSTLH